MSLLCFELGALYFVSRSTKHKVQSTKHNQTMRLFPSLVMLCAAFAAGAINAIAGGGTLLTFPVLIWLGLDPKVANGTSTVALWPGLFGGLFGYRKELEHSSTILSRLGVTSLIGGAFGALLLVRTPSKVF